MASGDLVDLADIIRWHAGLGAETRAWFDDAEPLTWLKHLLDRRGKRRSQWHVSALIVEEYVKSKKGTTSSTPPPQSTAASSSLETPSSQYRAKYAARRISAPPSDSSPGTSLSRVRSSDGNISFRPVVENSDSVGNSQTRGEGKARGWRTSIPAFLDSGSTNLTPSPYHHRNSSGGLSPTSSRLNFPDIIHRFRRHPTESEEGSSSPLGSQSEDQKDSAPGGPGKNRKRKDRSHLDQIQPSQETAAEINTSNDIPDMRAIASRPTDSTSVFPAHPGQEIVVLPEEAHPDATLSQPTPPWRKHSFRSTSVPLSPTAHQALPEPKGELDDQDQLETEYELRLRCASRVLFLWILSHVVQGHWRI